MRLSLPILRSSSPLLPVLILCIFVFVVSRCPGHDCDDLRDYTHERLRYPGECKCYHCQAKKYEWEKDKEIWERVRLREAKRGVYLMSWDMKVEVEQKVGHRPWVWVWPWPWLWAWPGDSSHRVDTLKGHMNVTHSSLFVSVYDLL